jgi:ubiquitin-like protein Pup
MSEQTRKTSSSRPSDSEHEALSSALLEEKGHKFGKELDALIDEIDGLLEENAEEFVANYVQRGGQ